MKVEKQAKIETRPAGDKLICQGDQAAAWSSGRGREKPSKRSKPSKRVGRSQSDSTWLIQASFFTFSFASQVPFSLLHNVMICYWFILCLTLFIYLFMIIVILKHLSRTCRHHHTPNLCSPGIFMDVPVTACWAAPERRRIKKTTAGGDKSEEGHKSQRHTSPRSKVPEVEFKGRWCTAASSPIKKKRRGVPAGMFYAH